MDVFICLGGLALEEHTHTYLEGAMHNWMPRCQNRNRNIYAHAMHRMTFSSS
jgi:hypothetical protein